MTEPPGPECFRAQPLTWSPEVCKCLCRFLQDRTADSSRGGKPLIVGLCGGSSCGKSTQVMPALRAALGNGIAVFAQDNCTNMAAPLSPEERRFRGDHPGSYDIERCRRLLTELSEGHEVNMGVYEHLHRRCTGTLRIRPKPVVLAEGLFTGEYWLGSVIDFTVYVEMTTYGRMMRRAFRSLFESYRAEPGRTIAGFFARVYEAHRRFVAPQRLEADLIVNVPYRFEDTRARFDLQPIHEYGDTLVCELETGDARTRVALVRSEGGGMYLGIRSDDFPYARIPLLPETVEALTVVDLKSC